MKTTSNLPGPAVPLVGPDGRLTPAWLQFFMSLFARTGGAPGISTGDTQAEAASGAPAPDLSRLHAILPVLEAGGAQPDLAPLYGLIYAVEAMAVQAMATGPLLERIADLEARIEAIAPVGVADTSQLTNGAQFLAAQNNLSDVATPATARTNLGLGSIVLTGAGTEVVNTADGSVQALVQPVASAVNYLRTVAGTAGNAVTLQADGSDANVDIVVAPKGAGLLKVPYGSSPAASPAAFSAQRYLALKDGNDIKWYIPVSTVTW